MQLTERDLRLENERLRALLGLSAANRMLQERIWELEGAARAMASDAPVVPLPKGERRIEIRGGALYLGLWTRDGFLHWAKAEGVRLDAPGATWPRAAMVRCGPSCCNYAKMSGNCLA